MSKGRAGLGVGVHAQVVAQQCLEFGQEGHQVAAAAGIVHAHGSLRRGGAAAMLASGVTPMPPATSTVPPGPVCSGKSFLGASIVSGVALAAAARA